MPYYQFIFIILCLTTGGLRANCDTTCHSHSDAPIGVMGGHLHHQGEWMVSYRFMDMSMEDNYEGSQKLSIAEARAMRPGGGAYMMVPVEMSMSMQMLGVMYAPNDLNTFMLMFNHLDQKMEVDMMGNRFETKSRGPGDTSLTWLKALPSQKFFSWHFGVGLHLPTGSIGEKDDTPTTGGNLTQLPYPMQLGSGTWDVEPSLTFLSDLESEKFSWGAQLKGKIRSGNNRQGYTLGDTFGAQLWTTWKWTGGLSSSLRIEKQHWGNIDGTDRDLASSLMMMPTADTSRRRGERLDMGLGLSLARPKGILSGHRFAIEWKGALHQDLEGPQLGLESSWTFGYRKVF
jgi:hypothetical protein